MADLSFEFGDPFVSKAEREERNENHLKYFFEVSTIVSLSSISIILLLSSANVKADNCPSIVSRLFAVYVFFIQTNTN